jgi:hypothetical protein
MKRFLKMAALFIAALMLTLVALAVALPYNRNGFLREQAVKMRMLSCHGRRAVVVLLGGSNVAFGYDSELISDSVNMPVINAGLHASAGLKYIIDDCFPRLRTGDILVFSPEYGHFFGKMAYGEAPMADLVYLSGMATAVDLNWRQWYALLNNTPKYLRSKVEYTFLNALPMAKDPVYCLSAFNRYGDVTAHWKLDDKRFSEPLTTSKLGEWNSDFFGYLIGKMEKLRARGIRIIVYPPVLAQTAYHNKRLDIEFTDSMLRTTPFPYIVEPRTVVYPDSFFYDTEYHLRKVGAERHSRDLLKILHRIGTRR